jgi:hypothetical protein
MSQVLLIHGSTVGVKYSVFRDDCMLDGKFSAYRDLLDTHQVMLFRWHHLQTKLTFWECLNPKTVAGVYLKEREYIQSTQAIEELHNILIKEKPQKIIAHSLGCEYLLRTINEYGLENSTTHIITLMSDAPEDFELTKPEVITRFKENKLHWFNYYCQWDQALISSWAVNKVKPAGLVGVQSEYATNIFYPLKGKFNLHTTIIEDPVLREKLLSL